jgi:hypothetical protein
MVWGSSALASPPMGATARVEETPEGTRVTLRPLGIGRWFGVAFLAVWLVGWAAGEVFAISILVGLAGAPLGWVGWKNAPTGLAALGVAGFLLVWSVLWTFGGVTAFFTLLRTAWGADVLTFGGDGWTLRQGIGRWGRCRRFRPGEVERLELRRRDRALVAEAGARTIVLSTYGTEADRRWLLDALRQIAGVAVDPPTRSSAPGRRRSLEPAGPPSGYRMEPMPDGTTRVTMTAGRRLGQAGCLLFITLFWNGIVGVFVAAGLGLTSMKIEGPGGAMALGAWGFWLFLTPFILIGLGLILGFLWSGFGREEWRLSDDLMEVRRAIPGRTWARRYTDATLLLDLTVDSDGDETWRLVLEGSGPKWSIETGDPAMLRSLGGLLAAHTGWPLREREGT